MIRKFVVVCAILFFCSLPLAYGQDTSPDAAAQLLRQGRTTYDEGTLSAARDAFRKLTEDHPDEAEYWYELARTDFYRSIAAEAHGDKKAAGRALEGAISNVQQAIKLNEKSAEAHSLLADCYGRKIGMGLAMINGPRYGPKVEDQNRRALGLDSSDARVQASVGREYLEAPKMYGGDLDKAIDSFRKATQLDPKFDEAYVWLAIALRKKGDRAGADQALQEALRLNPESVFAKETAAKK